VVLGKALPFDGQAGHSARTKQQWYAIPSNDAFFGQPTGDLHQFMLESHYWLEELGLPHLVPAFVECINTPQAGAGVSGAESSIAPPKPTASSSSVAATPSCGVSFFGAQEVPSTCTISNPYLVQVFPSPCNGPPSVPAVDLGTYSEALQLLRAYTGDNNASFR